MFRQYFGPVANDLRKSRFRVAALRVGLPACVAWRGSCNTACLNVSLASVGVPCKTCLARISCARALFSYCGNAGRRSISDER